MKNNNLEKRILKKVYKLETKNTFFEIFSKVILVAVFGFFIFVFASSIFDILNEQGSFDLFSFFQDGTEAIRKYFFDNITVFYQETPKLLLLILLALILVFVFLFLTFIRNYGKIINRIKSIYKFYKKNG